MDVEDSDRARADLKGSLREEVDRRHSHILELGTTIERTPELGFREIKASALVAREFGQLGLPFREGLAITGVKAKVACGRPGPAVAILGELDAVVSPQHPLADPLTGAAHACGHNGQIASMLGAAMALVGTGALGQLAGNVVFFAVPAEEFEEIDYRRALREAGKIEFLLGKQELIKLGEFDDVDMCILVHSTPRPEEKLAGAQYSANGFVQKTIRYIGKTADAAPKAHLGINALSAANIALHAIHAQRETFRDEDSVRLNPIVTKGGDNPDWVPSDVLMKTFVRGKTLEAIEDVDAKVDRCLKAGAMAMGAGVKIETLPGYSPLVNHRGLMEIYRRNCLPLIGGEENWTEGIHRRGGSDMGDMSLIMPALQPYNGGVRGESHGADHEIYDPEVFYLNPAKALAMTVVDLLYDDAREARGILSDWKPRFTREEYLMQLRMKSRSEEYQF